MVFIHYQINRSIRMNKSMQKKENNYNIILPSIIIYLIVAFVLFGWKFNYNLKEVTFIILLSSFVLIGSIYTISQLHVVLLNDHGLELKKVLTKRVRKFKPTEISFKIVSGSVYLSFSKIEVLVLNKNKRITRLNFKNMEELKEFPVGKRWEVLKR